MRPGPWSPLPDDPPGAPTFPRGAFGPNHRDRPSAMSSSLTMSYRSKTPLSLCPVILHGRVSGHPGATKFRTAERLRS